MIYFIKCQCVLYVHFTYIVQHIVLLNNDISPSVQNKRNYRPRDSLLEIKYTCAHTPCCAGDMGVGRLGGRKREKILETVKQKIREMQILAWMGRQDL